MPTNKPPPYYAADKDISDLLRSSKQRLTKRVILELARERGLYLSEEDDREQICDYVSLLPHGYPELERLFAQVETAQRPERTSTLTIPAPLDLEAISRAFNSVAEDRTARCGENYNTTALSEKVISIGVHYAEHDFSRTRLRQRTERDAAIEVVQREDGIVIRHPANERCKEIVAQAIEQIKNAKQAEVGEPKRIDLSRVRTAEGRTQFFTNLIRNVKGFVVKDVSAVGIDSEIAKEEIDEESMGEDPSDAVTEEALTVVRKAVLHGVGVLNTAEYQQFRKTGFYISRVAWSAQEDDPDGVRVEFEAGLGDAPAGGDFSYQIRGVIRRKSNKEFKSTRASVTEAERRDWAGRLEAAAWQALKEVDPSEGAQ